LYHKILLPTDGSKYAEKAAKHAIWIAGHSNAELIALNVVDTSSLVGLPAEDLTIRVSEILKDEGQKSLDNISKLIEELEKNEEFKTGVKLIKESKEGPPADVILKTVKEENIDLIVMGTSGKHGLDRFLLGSVTEKVVRSAKVPVLAVH
jgi:nucleotide-binding universal stress UspA family protein